MVIFPEMETFFLPNPPIFDRRQKSSADCVDFFPYYPYNLNEKIDTARL